MKNLPLHVNINKSQIHTSNPISRFECGHAEKVDRIISAKNDI
jgi:hypothetical protein